MGGERRFHIDGATILGFLNATPNILRNVG
jgi:hypothetical protein